MAMTKIETVTLGSTQAQIDFNSIPQTYTDLYIVASVRSTFTGSAERDQITFRFNGSSASNYSDKWLYGIPGVVTGSFADSSNSKGFLGYIPAATATSSTFGSSSIYIPNYTGSTHKSVSAESVGESNSESIGLAISAAIWADTSAITSISLLSYNTGNFVAGSTATLYGILKGSGGATVS